MGEYKKPRKRLEDGGTISEKSHIPSKQGKAEVAVLAYFKSDQIKSLLTPKGSWEGGGLERKFEKITAWLEFLLSL